MITGTNGIHKVQYLEEQAKYAPFPRPTALDAQFCTSDRPIIAFWLYCAPRTISTASFQNMNQLVSSRTVKPR